MADDRLSALEDDVRVLRDVAHDHGRQLAVLTTRAERAADEADRLRSVELGLARLRASLVVAVPVLTVGIPLLVRLLGSGT